MFIMSERVKVIRQLITLQTTIYVLLLSTYFHGLLVPDCYCLHVRDKRNDARSKTGSNNDVGGGV